MKSPPSTPAPDEEEVEHVLDVAEEAWLNGDDESALKHLRRLGLEHPRGRALAAVVWAYSGFLLRAHSALATAVRHLPPGDSERVFAEGVVAHFEWDFETARPRLEQLLAESPSPTLQQLLAICADAQGDFASGDRYQIAYRRWALPDAAPLIRMGPDAFHREVISAAELLPTAFRDALETTAIITDPMPSAELCVRAGEEPLPPELLGLFVGLSDLDKGTGSPDEPRRIYLFQRNLEREAESLEHLREQIRVTLFHELGHALGFDEDGVAQMGLA